MSENLIMNAVLEGMEDEDDLKDVSLSGSIEDKDIKYWSHYLRSWRFDSEEAARQRMFDLLQHHDKSTPLEPWGEAKNQWFSQAIPVYQDRFGKWRVGAPLMTWVKAKRKAAYQRRVDQTEASKIADKKRFEHMFPGWSYPGFGAWGNSHYRKESLDDDEFDIKEITPGEEDVLPDEHHGTSASQGGKRESYNVYHYGQHIGRLYTYHDEPGREPVPQNWHHGRVFYWELVGQAQNMGSGKEWAGGYTTGKDGAVSEVRRAYRRKRMEQDKLWQQRNESDSFSSDISDGTNGEPSAPAPFTSGQGEHSGLPDYKYLERQQKWAKRLKALRARRDPEGIEKPIGESEEDDFDVKEIAGPQLHYEKVRGVWPETHRITVTYADDTYPLGDYYLGDVWWHAAHPGSNDPKVGVLKQLDQEFPWTAQAVGKLYSGRARFKTKEEAANWLMSVRFKHLNEEPLTAFTDRWNALSAQAKRKPKRTQEGMEDEDEDDIKDIQGGHSVTVDEFVSKFRAVPRAVAARNNFHRTFFGTSRGEENELRELMAKHGLDLSHVWTVYSFAARPKEVYIAPGMKYPSGGAWGLDRVFGWFLTKEEPGPTIYRMDHNDVIDNYVYVL